MCEPSSPYTYTLLSTTGIGGLDRVKGGGGGGGGGGGCSYLCPTTYPLNLQDNLFTFLLTTGVLISDVSSQVS